MFGYVRPMRAELKVREFEAYRSCYCGLCRVLKEEYGARARMVLNYDFTFLAMLLWEPDVPFEIRKDRCAVMPCRKHCACRTGESLRLSAGYSVILAWWKLCDTVEDEGLFKALAARGARLWIRRAYRKAREQFPAFDRTVRERLDEIHAMEKAGESTLDRMADAFAQLLAACSECRTGAEQRELEQLLYHVGRWIYIVDAVDDVKRDAKTGQYNPVSRRFKLSDGEMDDDTRAYLKTTLLQSRDLACSALELMDENCWSSILRNILYLGLTSVSESVLDGTFRPDREGLPR